MASNLTLPARPRPLSHPLQGSSPLQVEKRDGPGGSYGQGRKQSMTLAQFLQRMAAGEDTLYLTTQQVRDHMLLLGRRVGTSGHFGHGGSELVRATLTQCSNGSAAHVCELVWARHTSHFFASPTLRRSAWAPTATRTSWATPCWRCRTTLSCARPSPATWSRSRSICGWGAPQTGPPVVCTMTSMTTCTS